MTITKTVKGKAKWDDLKYVPAIQKAQQTLLSRSFTIPSSPAFIDVITFNILKSSKHSTTEIGSLLMYKMVVIKVLF